MPPICSKAIRAFWEKVCQNRSQNSGSKIWRRSTGAGEVVGVLGGMIRKFSSLCFLLSPLSAATGKGSGVGRRFERPGERLPVEETPGLAHIHVFLLIVSGDHEGFEAGAAIVESGQQGAGDIVRSRRDGGRPQAGLAEPALLRHGVAEAQGVDCHAPGAGGVAAALFAEPLGKAIDVAGIRRDLFVRKVATIQVP